MSTIPPPTPPALMAEIWRTAVAVARQENMDVPPVAEAIAQACPPPPVQVLEKAFLAKKHLIGTLLQQFPNTQKLHMALELGDTTVLRSLLGSIPDVEHLLVQIREMDSLYESIYKGV